MDDRTARRNRKALVILFGVVAGMVGVSFAAVPLYDLFCRVTGYGGTPGVAQAPATVVEDRAVVVRFDASTSSLLPWRFGPAQEPVTIKVGETALAFYRAESLADAPTVGTATFNVTPQKAAKYFNKIDCFCFTEQRLDAGASADMAVSFFVDPAFVEDRYMDDVNTITLSYTFFPKHGTKRGELAAHAPAGKSESVQ